MEKSGMTNDMHAHPAPPKILEDVASRVVPGTGCLRVEIGLLSVAARLLY